MRALLLLACALTASPRVAPPVASFDLGISCADTGCVPVYDGQFDYQGPSSWNVERYTSLGPHQYQRLPGRLAGETDYELYFSPSVNSWFPSEGEVPGDVCGAAGSIAACMCSWRQVHLTLRTYMRDGTYLEQTATTPFMSGVDVERVSFPPVVGSIRAQELSVDAVLHFWFFGENLQPFALLQYTGCTRAILRVRPAPG